jgi:surface protein
MSSVTVMAYMFIGVSNFVSDVSSWDTPGVIDMGRMFNYSSTLDVDHSIPDISSVVLMY